MNTKILMTASAAFLALSGAGITFFPQELAARIGAQPAGTAVALFQLLGALYLGFAILNWMTRDKLIGGIYSRPIAMANFFHFAIGALALVKSAMAQHLALDITAVAVIYSSFGICFGLVLFTSPPPGSSTGRGA